MRESFDTGFNGALIHDEGGVCMFLVSFGGCKYWGGSLGTGLNFFSTGSGYWDEEPEY